MAEVEVGFVVGEQAFESVQSSLRRAVPLVGAEGAFATSAARATSPCVIPAR